MVDFTIAISIRSGIQLFVLGLDYSGASLFAGILFSSIGFVAFVYGKKQGSLKTMAIAGLLLLYPFLVTNVIAMYAIGILLTIGFFFRD